MHWTLLLGAIPLPFASGQQVYITAQGPTTRSQCTATYSATPSYRYSQFSYTLSETVRYATSVPVSAPTTTYAAPPESLTTLVPSLSYTTWGSWNPNSTNSANDTNDPYGQAAWTALWEYANPPNFTETSVFSTTVSPTPIPSGELVLPPRDYFGPSDCYNFPEGFSFGVASSASQIEGATAQEGKSPSLMDILVQDDRPKDYVTNENYYYYKQDIGMSLEKTLGLSNLLILSSEYRPALGYHKHPPPSPMVLIHTPSPYCTELSLLCADFVLAEGCGNG